jgi:ATP-dependent DNA helicase RecQ
VLQNLQVLFGFSSFRPGQEEAICSLQEGNHTLVVMPTGSGKSLIFQMAALQFSGLTLVISPLIALMQDQVDSLARHGIPATFINSAIGAAEQMARLENIDQCLALMGEHPEMKQVDVILPVPPSQQRAVDPVRAFSTALGDRMGLPVQQSLIKTRPTQPQYVTVPEMVTVPGKTQTVTSSIQTPFWLIDPSLVKTHFR